MWDTRSIHLDVRLPEDLAAQAEQVLKEDPEFFSRIVLYGLTRRSIYHHLRTREFSPEASPVDSVAAPS